MENKKDRLEELFRRSLGEEAAPRPEGWNEPSPDVWGKIQTGSAPATGPRFGLGFWRGVGIAAIVLLLVAIFFIWQNQREIDTLHDQLQAVENRDGNEKQVPVTGQQGFPNKTTDAQANPQAPVSTGEATQSNREILPAANDDVVAASGGGLSANVSAPAPKQSTGKRSASGNSKVGQGLDLPKAPNSLLDVDGFPSGIARPDVSGTKGEPATANHQSKTQTGSEQATPQALALPKAWVISQKEKEKTPQVQVPGLVATLAGDPAPPIKNHESTINNRQSKTNYVGLTASPMFTLRQITGLPTDRANQTTSTQVTFAAGLQAGFQIAPRWRLETGLQHSASRVLNETRRLVNFRMQDERPDQDGQLQSSYTLALSTSAGTAEAEVDLTRSPQMPVMDGREIPIRMTVAHETRQLDLPLLANFQVLDGPLSIGLRAGMMARYSLASTLQVEDVQVELPAFRYRQNRFVGQVRDAKTDGLSLHLLAGIDVDYHLGEHVSLSLSPTFAKALEPTADNGQTKTYLNSVGLYGGVRWWF